MFCAQFEAKTVLLGAGLVELDGWTCGEDTLGTRYSVSSRDGEQASRRPGPIASDIRALGVLILNVLYGVASPTKSERVALSEDDAQFCEVPRRRPGFVAETEWHVLDQIRLAAADSTGGELHVLNCMAELAGINQGDWLDESGF